MVQKKRIIKSFKDELIKKSREAILAAVQIYNNPQITFKSEAFITLSVIAWTYLFHAYYRNIKIDFRYYKMKGKNRRYDKTKQGAYKHWELERCLNDDCCPIDDDSKNNLKFLIGLRHEIEHQMTNRIDEYLSAKLQACCINFNYYIKQFFGNKYGVDNELALSIQFSPITPEQQEILLDNDFLSNNVSNYIGSFENNLTNEQLSNSKYAYRVMFMPITVNRKGQADKVIEFIKSDSPMADGLNKEYAYLKEIDKKKYFPSDVVKIIISEGFVKFTITNHTDLWKSMNAKEINKNYGTLVANKTWYWYENWIDVVRNHCKKNSDRYK